MLIVSRARAEQVARFVVGSLLLLPAVLTFGFALWFPALRTLGLSLQAAVLGRPAHFSGLANYGELWRDPHLGPALAHSALIALVRLLAVVALPALVGWLLGRQPPAVRLLARCALTLGLALSAPAALGLLWRLAVPQLAWLPGLALQGGAQALSSCLWLEALAFLGIGGALTATALLISRPLPARAARGVLILAAILALSSGLDAFSLPFVVTGEGPHQRSLTLVPHLFRTAFQQLRLGLAAAEASPYLLLSLALGLSFGLVSEVLNLRLVVTPGKPQRRLSWLPLLGGAVALALLVLPVLLLYLWGAGQAFLFPGHPLDHATSTLQVGLALLNGNLAPAVAILVFQLPAAYLGALSLSLVRPFGGLGSRLAFVALLASGFVPPLVAGIGLFDTLQRARLLNTQPGAGLPLIAGAASLYVLRLYFAGQVPVLERAGRMGRPAVEAFFRHVFGPSLRVAVLAGAVSLLLAGQSLLWPLLILASSELYPLSLRLVVLQSQLASDPAALAAGAWLALTCWGAGMLMLWWPLQALVLERLELVAEEPGAGSCPDSKAR